MGSESVAEHVFITTLTGWVLAQMVPEADVAKVTSLCLLHDLPETRTGDLNYVQKEYVTPRESQALEDLVNHLPFNHTIKGLLEEFNQGHSLEARLAHDADQLAFLLDLKQLADQGYQPPIKWIPHVQQRIHTEVGQAIAAKILDRASDEWWLKTIIDREAKKK
jgi:putative hydrolase of HD superfamily